MKTYSQKPAEVTRRWYVIDASEAPLGRIATKAARMLIGKDKPSLTSHVDGGDYVIIVNAASLVVSGNKLDQKFYHNHSGYPGGLRSRSLREVIEKDPTEALFMAVRGMLPVNKLRDGRLKRLKIYAGHEHGHAAQTPEKLNLKGAR